jgi:hypothetical protein
LGGESFVDGRDTARSILSPSIKLEEDRLEERAWSAWADLAMTSVVAR